MNTKEYVNKTLKEIWEDIAKLDSDENYSEQKMAEIQSRVAQIDAVIRVLQVSLYN